MTWIRTTPYADADDALQRAYEQVRSCYPAEYAVPCPATRNADGSNDSIVEAHSLFPQAMFHMMSGLGVLLQPDLPLTRRQQEMIASVVSVKNRCFY